MINTKKLRARYEMKALGIDAEVYPGDASDCESMKKLAAYAAFQGAMNQVIASVPEAQQTGRNRKNDGVHGK